MPGPPTLRDVLRDASEESHRGLDDRFVGAVGDVDGYAALLTLLAAFHASADPLLVRWQATSARAPSALTPSRATLYAADLRVLGRPTPPPMALDGLARDECGALTDGSGIALLYVVAGSTVGARHLLRMIPSSARASASRGLADAASGEAARLWRATRELLAAPADQEVARPAAQACAWIFAGLLGSVEAALAA